MRYRDCNNTFDNMRTAWRKYRPFVLMTAGLVLLVTFEVFWLQSSYDTARINLQEQETQILHGTIRDLEDSLFQVAFWAPEMSPEGNADCPPPLPFFSKHADRPDTAKVISFIHKIKSEGGDSLHVRQRHFRKGTMILGAFARQLAENADSAGVSAKMMEMLEDNLDASKEDWIDGLQLITYPDTVPEEAGLVSRAYFDMFSRQHYAIAFPGYRKYLLGQMLPQFLFALILLACIAGAFLMITASLRRQHRLAMIRSNLVSNITHELKTPIATVQVALEAIRNFNTDTERRQEYLAIAQSEVGRLSLLVDKVLTTSRSEDGEAALHVEVFDFKHFVNEILDTLKVQFNNTSARVQFDAEGRDFQIEGDKLHLSGLVHNLLDNALKYGGKPPQIDIQLTQQNGSLILRVADRGAGIPRAYREKIFEKFFRVPSGDVHDTKGHGLGLSYVAQVLQAHHGQVSVASQEGKGSTFTVTLPKHHAN